MNTDISALEHNFNAIRRQLQEHFPGLTLCFILSEDTDYTAAIARRRAEIEAHPAGRQMMKALKETKLAETPCLIAKARAKGILPFLGKEKTLACIMCVTDESYTDPERLRQRGFAMAWHVLNAMSNPTAESNLHAGGVIIPTYTDEASFAWHNMMADAFSALSLEMLGKRGSIRALEKRRNLQALTTRQHYHAEYYPFPVIADATNLVYSHERADEGFGKTNIFERALQMTHEIGLTFDQNVVLEWFAFAKPAQEMAWLNIDTRKILGAAAHTSEDAYARSVAYMVAESLGVEPAPLHGLGVYNTFTEIESNERLYRKISEEAFEEFLSRASAKNNADGFRHTAARQNKELLEGKFMEWCAPALIAAADTFEKSTDGGEQRADAVRATFRATTRNITADILRKLARAVTLVRREEIHPGPEHVAVILREDIDTRWMADTLLINPVSGR